MPDSTDAEAEQAPTTDPVAAARRAIWRLFEDGLIDQEHATEALLAIDVGIQRMRSQ